jgi:hypothetical protein
VYGTAKYSDWEELYMKELEHVKGNDIDGWLDEEALLSEEEQKDMKRDLLPIRTVLVKVLYLSLADA